MSKNSVGHDNSIQAVKKYINALVATNHVQSVWLGGSRSPLSPKNSYVHSGSDWDLQLIKGTDDNQFLSPADMGIYCDIYIRIKPSKYAVQIWPNDEHGILNEVS